MGNDNSNKKLNDNKQQAPGVNKDQDKQQLQNATPDRDRGGQQKQSVPQQGQNRDKR